MFRAVINAPRSSVSGDSHALTVYMCKKATPEVEAALKHGELYVRLGEMLAPAEVKTRVVLGGSLAVAYDLSAYFPLKQEGESL